MPSFTRPAAAALLAASVLAFAAEPAGAQDAGLRAKLAGTMARAGGASGAQVENITNGSTVFRLRSRVPRILASNTKLFTTAAALARYGVEGKLGTEVRGTATLDASGVYPGDLYLRGGGDPTFGSRSFTGRAYGSGATVEELARKLDEAGFQRVMGRVLGDESRFDSLRGGPDSRYGVSGYVGPLSGLAYNRGLATERRGGFQSSPPLFAAARLEAALKRRGIRVDRRAGVRSTPPEAQVLASAESPPMGRLARITNKPSDNFFAEMLLKALALQTGGRGTTGGGARLAMGFARRLGAPARLVDGSGLSRSNRASPAAVARLLVAMRQRDESKAFYDSLAIAGRDGTLKKRMRSGPARRRCRGKTGTIAGVSTLSGYCVARSGETYAFSFLMNRVSPFSARALQDRLAQAIAGVRTPARSEPAPVVP
jgi:D-alanyl-D-alanine carboxypeptidase/D-alanyl-D-alanine-endopeptidase (penicillin-binding protein 4)